ncbi:MAG: HAD hydrolase-like protein [Clostridia bacterium]|nr:HAD hydrolase-like protein [Clostridia bacterium]
MTNDKINLIFDCDGTLIDSYPAIADATRRLFLAHGVACDAEEIRGRALHTWLSRCIEDIAKENGLDPEMMLRDLSRFPENPAMIRPMPHADELLRCGRFRCFVYTHRGPGCRDIFTGLGMSDCFEEIVDSSYRFPRKPDGAGVGYLVEKYGLDRSGTYYVGDRSIDIECGLNAGTGTIFLRSSGLDIDCSRASFAVDDLKDIIGLPFPE